MTGQQGSKHEISECDCIPLNPLQTTQWCQIGASQLLVTAGITEVKWTQSRGLLQFSHVLLKISSFSSVVSEPDASAWCYIEEKMYPALGKACGDCISALYSALALAYFFHLSNTIHLVVTLPPLLNKQRIQPEPTDTLYLTCVGQMAPFALSSFPPRVFTLTFPKDLRV